MEKIVLVGVKDGIIIQGNISKEPIAFIPNDESHKLEDLLHGTEIEVEGYQFTPKERAMLKRMTPEQQEEACKAFIDET